jgi:hypothetical protein
MSIYQINQSSQKIYKNIYTLCKSGNHAIIFWIIHNLGGYSMDDSIKEVVYRSKDNNLCFVNNINHRVKRTPDLNSLLNYNKLLISNEDAYPQTLENNDIIILRDFYNTLASRYKLFKPSLGIPTQKYIHDLPTFIKYWKYLASLALSSQQFIYYNTWLTNKNYRDNVMRKLFMTKNAVDNIDFVPQIGSSSSYIGKQKENDTNSYLSRYKTTNLPEEWRNIVDSDIELQELCDQLSKELYD